LGYTSSSEAVEFVVSAAGAFSLVCTDVSTQCQQAHGLDHARGYRLLARFYSG
jgi:hypothetical protein